MVTGAIRDAEFQSAWVLWCPFYAKMGSTDSHSSDRRPGLRENFVRKVLLRREQARWSEQVSLAHRAAVLIGEFTDLFIH